MCHAINMGPYVRLYQQP